MSKEERFEFFTDEWDEFGWYIKDKKNNECFEYLEDITKILNQQSQRIAELEEQLKNAIVPKFMIGQQVWYLHIGRNKIYNGIAEDMQWRPINGMYYRIPNLQRDYFWIRDDELFATKEEALAKLEELKGE